jgi:hypothetical protein
LRTPSIIISLLLLWIMGDDTVWWYRWYRQAVLEAVRPFLRPFLRPLGRCCGRQAVRPAMPSGYVRTGLLSYIVKRSHNSRPLCYILTAKRSWQQTSPDSKAVLTAHFAIYDNKVVLT